MLRQFLQLWHRQITGSSSPEVNELRLASLEVIPLGVEFEFLHPGAHIAADFIGALIGIHPEIAKVAALPAKRNVKINSHGHILWCRLVQHLGNGWDLLRLPERKRRIVGNKVISRFGGVIDRDGGVGEFGAHTGKGEMIGVGIPEYFEWCGGLHS